MMCHVAVINLGNIGGCDRYNVQGKIIMHAVYFSLNAICLYVGKYILCMFRSF